MPKRIPAPKTAKKSQAVHERIVIPQLLNQSEAARLARVSVPTVSRWIRDGHLRVLRSPNGGIVRIYAESLAEFIEKNAVGGSRGAR